MPVRHDPIHSVHTVVCVFDSVAEVQLIFELLLDSDDLHQLPLIQLLVVELRQALRRPNDVPIAIS